MPSKLEQLRQEESKAQQEKSNFAILYGLYKESPQEQSLQKFIDEYTQGEEVPSDVRALYVTGDTRSYREHEDAFDVTDYVPDRSTWRGLQEENYNPLTLLPEEPRRIAAHISKALVGGTIDLGTTVAELATGSEEFTEFREKKRQAEGIALGQIFGKDIMDVDPDYWTPERAGIGEEYEIAELEEPTSGVGQVTADVGSFVAGFVGGRGALTAIGKKIKTPTKDPYKELQGGKGRKSKKVLEAEAALASRAKTLTYAKGFGAAEIGAQVAFDPIEIRIAYDIGQWAGDDTFLLSDIFNFLDLEDPEELSEVENRLGLLGENLVLGGLIATAFKIPRALSETYRGGKGLVAFLKNIKNGGPQAIEAFKTAISEGSKSNRALKTMADRELEMPYLRGDLARKAKDKGLGFLEPMANIVEQVGQRLTTRGFYTHQMFNIWKNADNAKISWERRAIDLSAKVESSIRKLAKEQNLSFKEADEIFTKYLNGTIKLKDISNKEARELAKDIRGHIDSFSRLLIKQLKRKTGDKKLDEAHAKKIKEIRQNMGKYLRKTYDMFENKKYMPSDEVEKKLTNLIAARLRGYADTVRGRKARYAEAEKRVKDLKDSAKGEKDYISHVNTVYGQKQLNKVFAHRKNIEPVLREFLGETTDASFTVFRTLTTLANSTANVRMFDDLLAVGKNKYFFTNATKASPRDKAAYKNVTDSRLKSTQIVGKEFHALEGYYTTDDIAELFLKNKKRLLDNENMAWYKTFLQYKGFGQASATVLNHITHLRNTMGGALMMMGNGLNPFDKEIRKSFKVVSEQFTDAVSKEKGLNELYLKYQKLGIVNQNVRVGEFKSLMNEGDILTRVDTGLKNRGFKIGQTTKGAKKLYKKAEQTYVAEDDIFRIASYEKELAVLKRANNLNPVSQRLSIEALENKAAEIVKNTLPTYDYVPAQIQKLRGLPFGNFYAFHAERFRNTYHGLIRGVEEINSGNAVLRERGMQRLSAKMVFGLGGQQIVSEGSKLMFGVTEQEDTAIKHLMLPKWSRNSEIAYYRDDDGNLIYMDLAYQHPDAPIINVFNAALNEFLDPNTPQAEIEDRLASGIYEAGKELVRPFITEALFTDAFLTVLSGQGRDSEGRIIRGWNIDADASDPMNVLAAVGHAAESLIPGTLKQLDPTGTLTSNKLGSQVWKSLTQENPVDRYGEKINPDVELFTNMTGLRFYKVTDDGIKRALEFKTRDFSRIKRAKEKEIRNAIQYGTPVEDILNTYLQKNKDYFDDYVGMRLAIEAAKELGVPSDFITARFKSIANMTGHERSLLMAGANSFVPLTLNSSRMSEILDKASFDTMNFQEFDIEYNKLRQHLLQLPLIDLLFEQDITLEDEQNLKLVDEDFPFFKTRLEKAQKDRKDRERFFTGELVSKDYPVTDAAENPGDRKLDNQPISFNEVAADKENPYPTYDDELKRLGFAEGKIARHAIEDLLKPSRPLPDIDILKPSSISDSTQNVNQYIRSQAKRLGLEIPEEEVFKNMNTFKNILGTAESDNRQTSQNLYEHLPDARKDALANLLDYAPQNKISLDFLKSIDLENPESWDEPTADIMMLGYILSQKGTDEPMSQILQGNFGTSKEGSVRQIYEDNWVREKFEDYVKRYPDTDPEGNLSRAFDEVINRQKFYEGERVGVETDYGSTKIEDEDIKTLLKGSLALLQPSNDLSLEDIQKSKLSLWSGPDKFPIEEDIFMNNLMPLLKTKQGNMASSAWRNHEALIPLSEAAIRDYLYPQEKSRYNKQYSNYPHAHSTKTAMKAMSRHLQQERDRQDEGMNPTKLADILNIPFDKAAEFASSLLSRQD